MFGLYFLAFRKEILEDGIESSCHAVHLPNIAPSKFKMDEQIASLERICHAAHPPIAARLKNSNRRKIKTVHGPTVGALNAESPKRTF